MIMMTPMGSLIIMMIDLFSFTGKLIDDSLRLAIKSSLPMIDIHESWFMNDPCLCNFQLDLE